MGRRRVQVTSRARRLSKGRGGRWRGRTVESYHTRTVSSHWTGRSGPSVRVATAWACAGIRRRLWNIQSILHIPCQKLQERSWDVIIGILIVISRSWEGKACIMDRKLTFILREHTNQVNCNNNLVFNGQEQQIQVSTLTFLYKIFKANFLSHKPASRTGLNLIRHNFECRSQVKAQCEPVCFTIKKSLLNKMKQYQDQIYNLWHPVRQSQWILLGRVQVRGLLWIPPFGHSAS